MQVRVARHTDRLEEVVRFVLYLGSWDAVRAAADRAGAEPVAPANPYWAEHGITLADPDGFRVVLAAATW